MAYAAQGLTGQHNFNLGVALGVWLPFAAVFNKRYWQCFLAGAPTFQLFTAGDAQTELVDIGVDLVFVAAGAYFDMVGVLYVLDINFDFWLFMLIGTVTADIALNKQALAQMIKLRIHT